MLPLSDGIPARRFPVVNVLLIVANFAVFICYELPHLNAAVYHASFYPCTVDGACHGPLPWGLSWITAMFLWFGTAQDAPAWIFLGLWFLYQLIEASFGAAQRLGERGRRGVLRPRRRVHLRREEQ
jgi:hypothetical protein